MTHQVQLTDIQLRFAHLGVCRTRRAAASRRQRPAGDKTQRARSAPRRGQKGTAARDSRLIGGAGTLSERGTAST